MLGLATDYCVKFTVLDALQSGYTVSVITDGCRGVNIHPQDSAQAFYGDWLPKARRCIPWQTGWNAGVVFKPGGGFALPGLRFFRCY